MNRNAIFPFISYEGNEKTSISKHLFKQSFGSFIFNLKVLLENL